MRNAHVSVPSYWVLERIVERQSVSRKLDPVFSVNLVRETSRNDGRAGGRAGRLERRNNAAQSQAGRGSAVLSFPGLETNVSME